MFSKTLKFILTALIILFIINNVSALCTDSDNGKNIYEKGIISSNEKYFFGNFIKTDYCQLSIFGEQNNLVEYYCDNNQIKSEIINCPYGCENGKCISTKEPLNNKNGFLNNLFLSIKGFFYVILPPCVPLNCTQQGKQCGNWTDGCGTNLNCGNCSGGGICVMGYCTINCTCNGKTCGDNGCGTSCGTCLTGYCNSTGQCALNTPDTNKPTVNLIFPLDKQIVNISLVNFTANVSDNVLVKNATLFIWNNLTSQLIFNQTIDVNSITKLVNITYSLNYRTYKWNYYACDNSSNCAWNSTNWTVTYQTSSGNSLIAYYPFEGNANDVSGNGYNGNISGATLTTGKIGQAYSFNGNNSYISVTGNWHKIPAKTISFWANPNCKLIQHQMPVSTGGNYYVSFYDVCNGNYFYTSISNSSNKQKTYAWLNKVIPNTWHHYAAVFDVIDNKVNRSIYVDGVLQGSYSFNEGYGTDYGSIFYIGGLGTYYNFNGSIDEVKVWNYALSSNEILTEYQRGNACVPQTCLQMGYNCGNSTDGCGTNINCGTCLSGYNCNSTGQCIQNIINISSQVSSCLTLSTPNTIYKLTNNIVQNSNANCIIVAAQNITLDCQGNSITSNYNISAVYTNQYNTIVKNCIINIGTGGNGNAVGINYASGANNGLIINNTISGDNGRGIMITSANYNNILSNNATSFSGIGIYLVTSSNNTLTGNIGTSNINQGIYLYSSNNNYLYNNFGYCYNPTGISASGIFIYSCYNNNIIGNTGTGTTNIGIYIYKGGNNLINNNSGISNTSIGLILYSSNNTLINNSGKSNSGSGIFLSSDFYPAKNNILIGNIGTSISGIGIYMYNVSNNTLNSNTGLSNSGQGIYLSLANNNNLSNNKGTSNSYIGFYLLSSSNNSLTGNIGSSNSNIGLYILTSSNNTIKTNTGISNSSVGIYLSSVSNSIVTSNTGISNSSYAFYLAASSNNTLSSNKGKSNSNIGIFLSSASNNNLTGNIGASNLSVGIYLVSSSNNILTGNNGTSNLSYGIFLYSSSNNNLTGNIGTSDKSIGTIIFTNSNNNILTNHKTASNGNIALYLYNSNGNIMANPSAIGYLSESYGIYFVNSSNTIIQDCINISGVTSDVLYATTPSYNNTFINCSYNANKESVIAGSQLIRKWYYRANATITNNKSVVANITAVNSLGGLEFSINTNSSGLSGITTITDYVNNGTRKYYSNYTITATNTSYNPNFVSDSFNASLGNNLNDKFLFGIVLQNPSQVNYTISWQEPKDSYVKLVKNNFTKIVFNVCCLLNSCSNSNIKLYYQYNNQEYLVSSVIGTKPFYVNATNPFVIPSMNKNECRNVTFWMNFTGNYSNYGFFGEVNPRTSSKGSYITEHAGTTLNCDGGCPEGDVCNCDTNECFTPLNNQCPSGKPPVKSPDGTSCGSSAYPSQYLSLDGKCPYVSFYGLHPGIFYPPADPTLTDFLSGNSNGNLPSYLINYYKPQFGNCDGSKSARSCKAVCDSWGCQGWSGDRGVFGYYGDGGGCIIDPNDPSSTCNCPQYKTPNGETVHTTPLERSIQTDLKCSGDWETYQEDWYRTCQFFIQGSVIEPGFAQFQSSCSPPDRSPDKLPLGYDWGSNQAYQQLGKKVFSQIILLPGGMGNDLCETKQVETGFYYYAYSFGNYVPAPITEKYIRCKYAILKSYKETTTTATSVKCCINGEYTHLGQIPVWNCNVPFPQTDGSGNLISSTTNAEGCPDYVDGVVTDCLPGPTCSWDPIPITSVETMPAPVQPDYDPPQCNSVCDVNKCEKCATQSCTAKSILYNTDNPFGIEINPNTYDWPNDVSGHVMGRDATVVNTCVSACGPNEKCDGIGNCIPECKTHADCASGQACLQKRSSDGIERYQCVYVCNDDSNCPQGESCYISTPNTLGVCTYIPCIFDFQCGVDSSGFKRMCGKGLGTTQTGGYPPNTHTYTTVTFDSLCSDNYCDGNPTGTLYNYNYPENAGKKFCPKNKNCVNNKCVDVTPECTGDTNCNLYINDPYTNVPLLKCVSGKCIPIYPINPPSNTCTNPSSCSSTGENPCNPCNSEIGEVWISKPIGLSNIARDIYPATNLNKNFNLAGLCIPDSCPVFGEVRDPDTGECKSPCKPCEELDNMGNCKTRCNGCERCQTDVDPDGNQYGACVYNCRQDEKCVDIKESVQQLYGGSSSIIPAYKQCKLKSSEDLLYYLDTYKVKTGICGQTTLLDGTTYNIPCCDANEDIKVASAYTPDCSNKNPCELDPKGYICNPGGCTDTYSCDGVNRMVEKAYCDSGTCKHSPIVLSENCMKDGPCSTCIIDRLGNSICGIPAGSSCLNGVCPV